MKSGRAVLCALALALAAETAAAAAVDGRIEARSNNLLAVALVRADQMTIHLSRLLDNAPIREAAVTVTLRGTVHPTTEEADGSYTLKTQDLELPGTATVQFQIVSAEGREDLKGTLERAADEKPQDKNSARQLWWWVLNFSVCIGFLWLLSRRRKTADT